MKRSATRLFWFVYIAATTIFVIAPLAVIIVYSFSPTRYMQLPPHGLSMRWYMAFFQSDQFMLGLRNTLILSLLTPPLCLAIVLPTAHGLVRRSFPGAAAIGAVMSSTLLLPGVVTGIAFLSFFNMLNVTDGLAKMIVAMTIVCLPYALHALIANYHGIDSSIEEAAQDLGGSPALIYFHIVLPQLKPGIIAGSIFIFAETVDNFSVNVFLADLRSNTLPIVTYEHMRNYDDPLVAVIAALLAGLAFIMVLILSRLVGLDRALTREN
jgi:ABC-type spermidine/putrescine transport system permease subunit II